LGEAKPKALEISPRRRRAEHFQRALDEVENFLLTWGEFHGRLR
jgi:hypothetical protein